MDSIGLSRLGDNERVHTLGCLQTRNTSDNPKNPTETETEEAVRKFIEDLKYNIHYTETDKQRWMYIIDRETNGWPKHLHSHLNGLAREIANTKERNPDQVNQEKVHEYATQNRNKYYEDRIMHHQLNRAGLARSRRER